MLAGEIRFLVSEELLWEYQRILYRPRIRTLHRMAPASLEGVLAALRENGEEVAPPEASVIAPDPRDQHLWDLLAFRSDSVLVTGDRRLLAAPDFPGRLVSARESVDRYLS